MSGLCRGIDNLTEAICSVGLVRHPVGEVLAQHRPTEAKAVLGGIIESIALTPGPDGYSAKLVLRNERPPRRTRGGRQAA